MKIGDLIMYKNRYIGQQFIVVGVRKVQKGKPLHQYEVEQAQCVSVQTGIKTRWSSTSTFTVLA